MDTQSEFEREIAGRVEKVEAAVLALAEKVDRLARGGAYAASGGTAEAQAATPIRTMPRPRGSPRPPRIPSEPVEERGADWWLARAGAGLTIVAVILLYQYAVGHGWITPTVRVLTGAAIGAALLYYGRKMAPADPGDSAPVALRELMMGAGLAAWYVTSFMVSARYHLIPLSGSRYLFLLLSIFGGALSLKVHRSGLALFAVTAGFLGPIILSDAVPSVPAYAFYIAVLGSLSVVLYLMRGWQSVLWISFFAMSLSLSLPVFYSRGILLTLMGLGFTFAFGRAPTLRRSLVATGADRYTEPVRSRFATNGARDLGRFFRFFSPAAGAPDSLSVWLITLSAPLIGITLLSRAWPTVSDAAWGALLVAAAIASYRMCASSNDENSEITHILGVASPVWGLFGAIGIARGLVPPSVLDHGTITLALLSIAAIGAVSLLKGPRFVAAVAVGRLMAGLAVAAVLSREAGLIILAGGRRVPSGVALSVADVIAIGAGVLAWRDMRRRGIGDSGRDVLILMSYIALLFVDARVLGEIWRPLVTPSFAVAGTAILFLSRKEDNKMLRAVGGATLGLVMLRLFFVDMNGVDTLWRVLLFLGIGALFLFTSRQLQVSKSVESGST